MRPIVLISMGICVIAAGVVIGFHGVSGAGTYCGSVFLPRSGSMTRLETFITDCNSVRDLSKEITWSLIGIGAIFVMAGGTQRLSGKYGGARKLGL